jgi:signal transduction histidine kinase
MAPMASSEVRPQYRLRMATATGGEGQSAPPVAETLRWVVAGFRILSWIWVVILIGVVIIGDKPGDPAILAMVVAIATAWTGVTVWAAREDARMRSTWFIVGDTIIALAIGVAGYLADTTEFVNGSWPNSWLFSLAYVSSLRWTLVGGSILVGEHVILHLLHGMDAVRTAGTFQYIVFALIAGWAFETLRTREALRLEAEARLAEERQANTRYQARVELARRLHDSYLQTLVATRAAAENADDVRFLTRRQERELRRTIAEFRSPHEHSFKASLLRSRDEVADLYPRVEIVEVIRDDAEMSESLEAAVGAAREAMVNAVKHSGSDTVDLYSEIEGGHVAIHIRDRGVGFDQEMARTRGLSLSLTDPIEEHGGSVAISSVPDHGTEVVIRVPV